MLLKRLARRRLPREVVDRPKVGFTVPLSPWFRGPAARAGRGHAALADLPRPRLLSTPTVLRGYVDDHLDGRRDRARELWTLLTLELWHRAFIDSKPGPAVAWRPPARVAAPAA